MKNDIKDGATFRLKNPMRARFDDARIRSIQRDNQGPMGMNRTFKAAVASLVFAVGFAGSIAAGPAQDDAAAELYKAAEAFRKGWYATALELLRPLAEQGNSGAQTRLGGMYASGRGVPQDLAEALSWYRKAAEQGDASAQFSLGAMYFSGRGVPQDNGLAHMWFNLAAAAEANTGRGL
jgi:uncharacterized protein